MVFIPSMLLKRLYTFGSLENTTGGFQFSIANRLSDAKLKGFQSIAIDGKVVPLDRVTIDFGKGQKMTPQQLNGQAIDFPLRKKVMISIQATPLEKGKHELEMTFQTSPFGKLNFSVDDSISEKVEITRILRSKDDDYGELVINERQRFVERFSPAKL